MIPPWRVLAHLQIEFGWQLWRALCLAPLEFMAQKPPPRKPEHPAMTAPIERATDWEPERKGGEVVEFRKEGRL